MRGGWAAWCGELLLLGGGMWCVVSGTSCDSCMPSSSSMASLSCANRCVTFARVSSRMSWRWLVAARHTGQTNSPTFRFGCVKAEAALACEALSAAISSEMQWRQKKWEQGRRTGEEHTK